MSHLDILWMQTTIFTGDRDWQPTYFGSMSRCVTSFTSLILLALILVGAPFLEGSSEIKITDVKIAQAELDDFNEKIKPLSYASAQRNWEYQTNITDYNLKQTTKPLKEFQNYEKQVTKKMLRFDATNMPAIIKREIKKFQDIGTNAQTNKTKSERLTELTNNMSTIYNTAKPCLTSLKWKCLPLEPDLKDLLRKNRTYEILLDAWKGWRNAAGTQMKDLYPEYVTLMNDALSISGFKDAGEYWRSHYEMEDLQGELMTFFEELHPLYKHLHAFARRKLKAFYGKDKFPATGHIPAHLLGDMWSEKWLGVSDLLKPFQNRPSMDITQELIKQNYTPLKMFQKAEEFFVSLGQIPMPQSFWENSMLEKPSDGREVVCHASAWDFGNSKDFRIKQCASVTHDDFMVAHHEMGHIEYMLQYKHLPYKLQYGANPGFHEALGDTIALSVQSPKHLRQMGLLPDFTDDKEADLNFLMTMALHKVASLPLGYMVDAWRWGVFDGTTSPAKYNDRWWDLRCKLQGVSPPVERCATDFDPGSIFHVSNNYPFIQYFVANIIQFQFHKAACEKAGHSGPLHRCDIYGSKEAGKAISDMMELGLSKPWPDVMEQLTGQRTMSAKPLLEYFQPLLDYLKEQNGDDLGWEEACPE